MLASYVLCYYLYGKDTSAMLVYQVWAGQVWYWSGRPFIPRFIHPDQIQSTQRHPVYAHSGLSPICMQFVVHVVSQAII